MRGVGTLGSLEDLHVHDHACWAFSDRDEWHNRAVEFLGAGLEQGQQVRYVGPGTPDELIEVFRPLGDVPRLVADDRLGLLPVYDLYPEDEVIDPGEQVTTFAAAAGTAVERGFTGLRVAADVSSLTRTPAQLEAYARYEFQIDQAIGTFPLTGLCGLDRTQLAPETVDRLGCLHPLGTEAPFRIYSGDSNVALGGEVDDAVIDLFGWTLDHLTLTEGADIYVDARGAGFLDHHALIELERLGDLMQQPVVLVTARTTPRRMSDMMPLHWLRVDVRR